ncbi:hypothetical protein PS712_05842 [Pseudomonas fluorescens]|uniref:Uncharacterized protein n=1 Tax=Pseudomonas fluorescens TaxID=294 RepID=A0A5E7FMJ8_PSEFL|nr:hypothetical protein PS712_05842 [Pseudomonas fluorescens]
MGGGQLFHPLQCLDPALGLTGLGSLRLKAGDVAFHVRTLHLLLLVGLLLLGQTFGTGTLEGAVATAIESDFALIDVRDVIDHGIEEVPVVGNQHQGARVAFEPLFEPDDGVEVQVVGRFVEQQQVRTIPGDQRQGQTRFLATGEIQHRLVDPRAAEVETTEEVAQGLLALGRRQTLQVQQRAGLGVQRVELMLGEVANHGVLATGQATGQWRKLTGEVLDQGRFTGTVRAEQANPCARGQLQLDLLEHGFVAVTQAGIGQIDQRAGDFLRFTENKIERRIDVGGGQLFHPLQCLDPALGLTGLGSLRLKAGDVAFHVRTLHLLLLVGLLLLGQTFGTGTLEGAVATAIESDFALIDVRDVIDHGIEEVPVVGNQHQGARVAFEPLFEPDDGVEVQVVGRFVEQQQVRWTHQGLRQVQTHPPATGEVPDLAIHLLVGEAQASQQLARPGVGGVPVGAVELGVQAGLCGTVMGRFGCRQVALHLAQAQVAIEHVVDRQAFERVDLLAHVGDTPVGRQEAITRVRVQFAPKQGEQARFAGAVGTDQAGFLAGVQGQLGVF